MALQHAVKRGLSGAGCYLVMLTALFAAVAFGDNLATQQSFDTAHDAARHVLARYNPESIASNREMGGYIYRQADGRYTSSPVVMGEHGHLQFEKLATAIPADARAVASWHTHGATMPGVVSEIFSPRDIRFNRTTGLDGYLVTPQGQFKYYDPDSGEVTLLGVIAEE